MRVLLLILLPFTTLCQQQNGQSFISTGSTSFAWSSKAFSSTYAASAGLYFVALLYNSSAQTTAPALRANQLSSDLLNTVDFTNTAKASASLTGQTGFPAGPTAMSTLTTNSAIPYLALY